MAGRRTLGPLSSAGILGALCTFSLLSTLGCGHDTTATPPARPLDQLYWTLELNQHAVMLALVPSYDTAQLTVIPKNAFGAPIAMTGTVTFHSLDTTVVVSPTGLLTAHALTTSGEPVRVIASLRDPQQGVTHADTAYIVVTATVPAVIDTFSMQPVVGDSAKRGLGRSDVGTDRFPWPVRAVDATGTSVCSAQSCALLVRYRSSNPGVATIDSLTGQVITKDTGRVVFTAQTLAYGQQLRDSVRFQIGYKTFDSVFIFLTVVLGVLTAGFFAPKKLIVGVGATVLFCNSGTDPNTGRTTQEAKPVDIVFDHPEAVDSASCVVQGTALVPSTGSGNIAPFGGDTTQPITANMLCRQFHAPGVYRYHSTLFPSDTYEIDVQRDPQ